MELRKKLLSLLLCAAFLLSVAAIPAAAAGDISPQESAPAAFMRGDLNGDGQRTALDYIMLKRHVMGTYRILDAYLAAADIDRNGRTDSMDYVLLKRNVMNSYYIQDSVTEQEEPSEILRFAIAFSLFYRTADGDRLLALEGELGIELNALNELVIRYLASLSIDGEELLRLENEIAIQLSTPEQIEAFLSSLAGQIVAWLETIFPHP